MVRVRDDTGTDALDAAILRVLSRDARATYAQVGQQVSLSAPAVKRRVDRLRESGVIRGFTVRLDPAAMGWHTEAFVELFCHGSTSPATMRDAVEQYPEVVAASTVTGDVDLVVQVRARDMRHLERVVERLAAEPFVSRTRSTVVLSALVRRPDVPADLAAQEAVPPAGV
ncbi:Lrp/AsnC family transcriptional regulator [Cellulomonas fimi]|uniref:Transcriptional regulator, AsnC family n=1 Tax=Cellulomonas fimi (strain ATCC 484 / DSM 20113 / JCM 1341 / CCUG 24087 / LMG 16345 / NBRC 15513 / NCIMB 8980 / NCTC 7547 / NRS-133) TaxID=590998 RepID=F4GZG0_CELFA|nr:Lrp/AsnC family transcriptional regulator [Cellulomonas fimi]AEE44881.1 transcriptional regulator, AsnC family [Cellulomonas fimi ATCC 484]NNH08116.1 Lrp/AsnC family transcriptional regulator [Cellulomonas fimi]VEH27569.1 Regulatory protein AsnC [Cellulomonas fimi]